MLKSRGGPTIENFYRKGCFDRGLSILKKKLLEASKIISFLVGKASLSGDVYEGNMLGSLLTCNKDFQGQCFRSCLHSVNKPDIQATLGGQSFVWCFFAPQTAQEGRSFKASGRSCTIGIHASAH